MYLKLYLLKDMYISSPVLMRHAEICKVQCNFCSNQHSISSLYFFCVENIHVGRKGTCVYVCVYKFEICINICIK